MSNFSVLRIEVNNRLSEVVVDHLEREHGRVAITKYGRPPAVMLTPEDLESLEEMHAISVIRTARGYPRGGRRCNRRP